MAELTLTINLALENKVTTVTCIKSTTAEDVCITLCKQLGIGLAARHLFALRIANKNVFLMPAATFGEKSLTCDLRVRFKVANSSKLKKLDIKAYDYLFHQARGDVLENKVSDLLYEKYKSELVGLGITDMYRVMLEKDLPRESLVDNYKKYIPKEVIKRHHFFVKKPIHSTLGKLQKAGHNAWYVKGEYLKQLDNLVPEYLAEEYKAITEENGTIFSIIIRVSPYHPAMPGVMYSLESKRDQWKKICTIDDIGFVSIREDGTVEISRKSGIPFYVKFNSVPIMLSFVSLLDGYYRLTAKWTFNICKEVFTPSLIRLYEMKCHGPVGGEFSYAKLEEKCGNRPGCFILRESDSKYNVFYIDVNMRDSQKPKTFKLERTTRDEFIFNDDPTKYRNIRDLMAAYSKPDGAIFLHECLPPSEYDKSPLLLCQSDSLSGDSLTDSSEVNDIIPTSPLMINTKDLQVYKGQRKEGTEGITVVYRSMWKVAKGKKVEAAMKVLKSENCDKYLRFSEPSLYPFSHSNFLSYELLRNNWSLRLTHYRILITLQEFLELAGKWGFIQTSSVVRLYGLTMTGQVSMVMEYLRYGPLDQYLRDKRNTIKQVDLIESAANLASALWHLEENRIVHGNIRCRKLLVSCHDENCFTVKLADPGIHTSFASTEVHWIPPECYSNLDYAKRSTAADVWAFATTLFEIFTYGETMKSIDHTELMRFYLSGNRLPRPNDCPDDIYLVMYDCWNADPHRRKQPQAIMRDIKQILYQVFNSRRVHSYAKITPKSNYTPSSLASACSTASVCTESTFLPPNNDVITVSEMDSDVDSRSHHSRNWLFNSQEFENFEDDGCNISAIISNFTFSTATTSLDSFNSIQSIFELDADCNIVLQGRIGQGFYGEVFKGMLEHLGNEFDPRLVAVKKLKTNAAASCLQDFEREINIMKTLKHKNIVEILGVLQDPEISLVMEYVQHGSLQSYLKINRESLSVRQLLKYALDISKGMDYLGKKNIVHRDLAARNILVVDESHVKISDFGLAQVMGTNDYYILKTNRELPIKWYALESLRDGKFSVRSDVWSYGVTMCEMFGYGEEPQLTGIDLSKEQGQEQQILLNALESGSRFPCPPMCPQAVYVRMIYPCWKPDPHERPPFEELCNEAEDLLTQH